MESPGCAESDKWQKKLIRFKFKTLIIPLIQSDFLHLKYFLTPNASAALHQAAQEGDGKIISSWSPQLRLDSQVNHMHIKAITCISHKSPSV